ncbi:Clp protease N-terminal domain-containing protein [Microlunatus capsulatus]|uniref:ATP-dependent Clp protease ATP-binding subunit ClpA n=1 Tax=Microlunatus capsulatus TaxID=99117 RepID=A0ABS4Z7F2_9ACTN|nr:Clp protease N-terminal domain-containing protein [Microlunatus capsulatus]MBP2416980.1 ATP-dependent Clp protease ATP-binding subunit ClpA [Microlunatus capsulatus]
MFERFTTAARAAVVGAQSHARQAGHAEIGAADLLAGVLDDVDGIPARVLADLGVVAGEGVAATEEVFDADDAAALGALGVDLDAVRRRAEETFGPGALDRRRRQRPGLFGRRSGAGHLPFNREAKSALELSLREALAEGHRSLGTEHVFLGLLATEEGTALRVLHRLGVTEDRAALRRRVLARRAAAA